MDSEMDIQNQKSMAEYIEREKLRDALYEADAITMRGVAILNRFPAADVVARDCYDRLLAENDALRKERPMARSRWVFDYWEQKWTCINCMRSYSFLTVENAAEEWDYCPNCGARMDGDGE